MHNRLPDSIVTLLPEFFGYNVGWSIDWAEVTQSTYPGECMLTIKGGADWPSRLVVRVIMTANGCVTEGKEELTLALEEARARVAEYPADANSANELEVLELVLKIITLSEEDKREYDEFSSRPIYTADILT